MDYVESFRIEGLYDELERILGEEWGEEGGERKEGNRMRRGKDEEERNMLYIFCLEGKYVFVSMVVWYFCYIKIFMFYFKILLYNL